MQVYGRSKVTGKVRLIPEGWLDHPVLSERWEAVPDPTLPDKSWTIAQLRTYADGRGIDLTGKSRHAEIFKAISEAGAVNHNDNGGDHAGEQ